MCKVDWELIKAIIQTMQRIKIKNISKSYTINNHQLFLNRMKTINKKHNSNNTSNRN